MRRPELLARAELDGAWTRLTVRYRRNSAARARRAAGQWRPAPRAPAPELAASSPPQEEHPAKNSPEGKTDGASAAPRRAEASPPRWTAREPSAGTGEWTGAVPAAEAATVAADAGLKQGNGHGGGAGRGRSATQRRRPRPAATAGGGDAEEAVAPGAAPRSARPVGGDEAARTPPRRRARRAESRFSTASFAPAAVLLGEPTATSEQREAAGAATAAFLGVSTSWETSDEGMRVRARLAGMGGQWDSHSDNRLSPLRGHGPGHGGADA